MNTIRIMSSKRNYIIIVINVRCARIVVCLGNSLPSHWYSHTAIRCDSSVLVRVFRQV